jgi:hypothetical protein
MQRNQASTGFASNVIVTIMRRPCHMIPILPALYNGELRNLQSMPGMQAEKKESTLFSRFQSRMLDHANNSL